MNVGSLFSGIGGFDLGLERAGMRTVWFCEQDEFCQHVLAKHWPGIPCHPDITRLRGADVEPIDVLCGGFPCQDLSYAGKGAGLAGARSGLWSEYARLIGEIRPRYVLVENVSALLARGLGVVLADLAALGYDAEWDCIPASAVGAPHRRDRIWLVAYPNREGESGKPVNARSGRGLMVSGTGPRFPDSDGEGLQGRRLSSSEGPQVTGARDDRSHMADAAHVGHERSRDGRTGPTDSSLRSVPSHGWLTEPDVGRVAHELSPGLDGGEVDDPERRCYQEARAAGASHADAMRTVREYGAAAPAPLGLHQARGDRGGVHPLPREDGRPGRNAAGEEAEGLHDLRDDVHALQPLAGEDLLAAMSQRSWPPRGHEAMGWWDIEPPIGRVAHGVPDRVSRLRSLGNALVPQIAEWIGGRVMAYENALLEDVAA